jgi:hypothetical protein
MANKDIVNGFSPYGRVYDCNEYLAESICYPGDALKKHSSGTVEPAAAGNAILGVAAHYAAVGAKVLVYDNPKQQFSVQADDATIDAQTDIGLNYHIIVAAGDTTYKRSGMELDASTQTTIATVPLKLIQIVPSADNALGANVKCIVKINNHQNGPATGVVGV